MTKSIKLLFFRQLSLIYIFPFMFFQRFITFLYCFQLLQIFFILSVIYNFFYCFSLHLSLPFQSFITFNYYNFTYRSNLTQKLQFINYQKTLFGVDKGRPKFRAADPRNMYKIIRVKNSHKIWSDLKEFRCKFCQPTIY